VKGHVNPYIIVENKNMLMHSFVFEAFIQLFNIFLKTLPAQIRGFVVRTI